MLKVVYPRNGTKVSNADIKLRWASHTAIAPPGGYLVEIFALTKNGTSAHVTRIAAVNTSRNSLLRPLAPGAAYYVRVTMGAPRITSSPSLMPTASWQADGFVVLDRAVGGSLSGPATTGPTACGSLFYVKLAQNYLEAYLQQKRARLAADLRIGRRPKPIVPLMFHLLDRHLDPKVTERNEADDAFSRALAERDPAFQDPTRLRRVSESYRATPRRLLQTLYGPAGGLPTDVGDAAWIKDAVEKLLSCHPTAVALRDAAGASKQAKLSFKYPLVSGACTIGGAHPTALNLRLSAADVNQYAISATHAYVLLVYTSFGSSVRIPLSVTSLPDEGLQLSAAAGCFDGVDSAAYGADVLELPAVGASADATRKLWTQGVLEVSGGVPIVLKVEPSATVNNTTEPVRVWVRDAGADHGQRTIFRHSTVAPREVKSPHVCAQTLQYQVFEIPPQKIAGAQPGEYAVTFHNDGVASSNSGVLTIVAQSFKLDVSELTCLNESDPEWFGDDSISFQTFISTARFVQTPTQSPVYDGFRKGHTLSTQQLGANAACVYHRVDQQRLARGIEGAMLVGVAVYEHDDLEWLSWLINEICDLVQSLLAHMVDAYTLGLGGFLVEGVLEASGLNDIREQAVESMVAGWEVEVLHQGSVTIAPPTTLNPPAATTPLTMTTSESSYRIGFRLTATS